MFTRIAVVNRGESAVRLVRAVRELNEEHGYGIKVVALHTEAERRALFVRSADESVCLRDVGSSSSPYLEHEELARALAVSRADAVWVGWGFVAEDPAFVELCERMGLVFIGPRAGAMRQLCDRIEVRLLAEMTGVPVAAWSGGPVSSVQDAARHGEAIGYPLVIKARVPGHPGRPVRRGARRRLPQRPDRGREGLWRPGRLHREPGQRWSQRRGADRRGRPWFGLGPRGPRRLHPTAQQLEAGRGVSFSRTHG
jgi:acetyl/propionyl-CoA carboxylase alpha subunit